MTSPQANAPYGRRRSTPRTRRTAPRATGATLVEFAIIFPVAVVFTLALIQTGLWLSARHIVKQAAFFGARQGAVDHADRGAMRKAVVRALAPLYQNSSVDDDNQRLLQARLSAATDLALDLNLQVEVLAPRAADFADFGLDDGNGRRAIPNDNLEQRTTTPGVQSGRSIQDANVLHIRVTYAYPSKVPVIASLMRVAMCGGKAATPAFGGTVSFFERGADLSSCARYYARGRLPIVSEAIVQMHSSAREP